MFYDDLFFALNQKKIKFMVAGGVAVTLHGAVRMTVDLDLMISLDPENGKKFIGLMESMGYVPRLPVKAKDFADPELRTRWTNEKNMLVFSWHHPKRPQELIDVFISNPIPFDEAYARRAVVKAGKVDIPLVSIGDLIAMKKASGRSQDLADIEALKKLRK